MRMTLEEYFNNLTEASNLGLAKKVSRESVQKDPIDSLGQTNDSISRLIIKTFDKVVSNNGVSVSTLDVPKIKDPDTVVGKWHMFSKDLGDQSGIAMMIKSGVVSNKVYLLASIIEISDVNDTTHWDNVHTKYLTPSGVLPIWNGKFNYQLEDEDKFLKGISCIPTIYYLKEKGIEIPFVWVEEPGTWWDRAWLRDFSEVASDLKTLAKTLDERIKLAEHDVLYRKNLFNNYTITQ